MRQKPYPTKLGLSKNLRLSGPEIKHSCSKKKKKTKKPKRSNKVTPNDILLYSQISVLLSYCQRFPPAADSNKCRDPQPDIMQGMKNLGTNNPFPQGSCGKGDERLSELEGMEVTEKTSLSRSTRSIFCLGFFSFFIPFFVCFYFILFQCVSFVLFLLFQYIKMYQPLEACSFSNDRQEVGGAGLEVERSWEDQREGKP